MQRFFKFIEMRLSKIFEVFYFYFFDVFQRVSNNVFLAVQIRIMIKVCDGLRRYLTKVQVHFIGVPLTFILLSFLIIHPAINESAKIKIVFPD